LQIHSETQKFHLCEIKNYYHTVTGAANHRADAVVFMETDPFHPWFLDFVQAQIDVFDDDRVLDHLNTSHRAKIAALVKDHEGIPRTSIIPMAFASNGVFHQSALAFIDWFLVQAARTPINEPPAFEKLKVLNAMCAAIVDQTAIILTSHFSQFITLLHNQSFPLVLAVAASQPFSQRSSRGALGRSQNAALSSQSQPVEPMPPIHADPGSPATPQSTRPPLSRSSERIRLRSGGGGLAVELGGRR
jgi:hypothetical protein